VALWFIALLASAVGCWWLVNRWGWRRSWVVLAPIVVAVLWGFSDELLQLVPNVF
jgi:predicted exporter